MIKLRIPLLLALGVTLLLMPRLFEWYNNKSFPKEKIEASFKPITSKYGIKIVYEIGDDFFSPMKNPLVPAGPHRKSKVKPIRHRVLMHYPSILQKAMDKYPDTVIINYLSAIHFANDIDQAGFKFGGSFDPFRKIIYLVDHGGKNDAQAMGTFHHEFSSLLMAHHSFWINSWTDHHPKDFKYLGDIYDSWQAVNEARKAFKADEYYEIGLVTNYGLTGFGNDFSEYSKMIFTDPEKFKKIMNQYPRVRAKFLVWLDFYQTIDPIFTEEYLFGNSGNGSK